MARISQVSEIGLGSQELLEIEICDTACTTFYFYIFICDSCFKKLCIVFLFSCSFWLHAFSIDLLIMFSP